MNGEVEIHPSAVVDEGASLGPGTRIWHFCHVMAGAQVGSGVILGQNTFVAAGVRIGDHCRIQNNVSLFAGVVLEDGVFVGPSAVFTNVKRPRARFPRKHAFEQTLVCSGATIGANATILCGRRVGRGAMVGAGAVVTHNVPAFALVLGQPAGMVGWVCLCGERLNPELACDSCGRIFQEGPDGLEAGQPI